MHRWAGPVLVGVVVFLVMAVWTITFGRSWTLTVLDGILAVAAVFLARWLAGGTWKRGE